MSPNDLRLYRVFLSSFALAACNEKPAGFGYNCCVEREWPTSAETAKAYAGKDAGDTLGCPSSVEPNDKVMDAGTPPSGSMELSAMATQRERGDGGGVCVYKTTSCCPGGRPFLAESGAIVASRVRGTSWSRERARIIVDRPDIARAWLEDALAEHASVASFARATLELMAAGAPPDLLAAHQRAALDEIRHAELCFGLAAAYGGEPVDPGPISIASPRPVDRLAANVLVEGCIAETIGALAASRAYEACSVPEVRDVLAIIAADEAEHAALAWRTLAWALANGFALDLETPRVEFAAGVHCPEHGRLGKDEIARATKDAWTYVIEPIRSRFLCEGVG